jgi:hypothetical protein
MASGPKTEYLIASYQRSIAHDNEQKVQIDQTIAGLEIRTADDEDPVHIIEGLNDQINRFDPSTKGLDRRILEINNQIKSIQNQILILGQQANAIGCGTTSVPIVNVVEDRVILHSWSFTSPNPFSKSTQELSSSNVGVGTYDGITQVSIGTYLGFQTPIVGGCVGYSNSITSLNNSLTTYRAERDAVIVQINVIKEARSTYELQRFGYNNAKTQLDAQIQKKSILINALQDPENQKYFEE